MKIILDTNVIVSALMTPSGIPAKVLNLVLKRTVKLLYNNSILTEYIDVLNRKELRINKISSHLVIDFIRTEGMFLITSPLSIKFNHEDDKKFYELFKSGEADYLLTGNIKHFPRERGIVTPNSFIERELEK